jgi:hypothetical protein
MRATEFIKDDTINRNPASKQWQVRADDDMALKYETPSQVLKDTTVVVQPNKKIFAYIQGTPVTSFDPTGLESFPIQFRRDADYPFYRTDTDEPITDCDYVAFHRDGSVVGYQDDELVNEIDRRGFLGAIGAGAMAAAGVPAQAKPKQARTNCFSKCSYRSRRNATQNCFTCRYAWCRTSTVSSTMLSRVGGLWSHARIC